MKNKLNAAALLALSASLAACSSGGGSSSTPQSTPVVSAEQKAAAEAAKKLAAEKAAAEAAAKKAAAEAAAKKAAEEAAKKAAAEAAAKKAAEEAAKKLAAEKAAAEAAAKKAAEEAAKKAAEEAARKAAEAAALEAKMKPLIEKAQKVGFSDAEAKAYAVKNVALSNVVAEQNLKTEIEAKADRDRALRIPYVDGQKVFNKVNAIDSTSKQSGAKVEYKRPDGVYGGYFTKRTDINNANGVVVIDGKEVAQTRIGSEIVLVQPYSIVYGNMLNNVSVDGKTIIDPTDRVYFRIDEIAGYAVTDASLPTEGKAVYKPANDVHYLADLRSATTSNGLTYKQDNDRIDAYSFSYTVDFAGKTGSGQMEIGGYLAPKDAKSSYNTYKVMLNEGVLKKLKIDNVTTYGVQGSVNVASSGYTGEYKTDGRYIVGLFGPQAEELAGRVTINAPFALITNGTQTDRKDQVEIGVVGTRGTIQK
ncbi:factor H binding protein domain-containing protein [Moraxella pluranimalium]|uniref:Factor H binding protein-like C-terminal domain-containing protein n=1 Tax=Moraxella pluranimalium TaxID=470453 RepID=A0A1T0CKQ6_9GAMM|nr:factor H binding protein domain-containing protein [Moraxella pluranimalium]OOS22917.1 hypothetical protein B0680_08865 [Moraxella pluranimalium]